MGANKSARWCGITLAAAVLIACSSTPPPPPQPSSLPAPPDRLVHDPRILELGAHAGAAAVVGTIVLVRVVEVEKPSPAYATEFAPAYATEFATTHTTTQATLLVVKSWKGALPAGRLLRVPRNSGTCNGTLASCFSFQFQLGDKDKEFLIMSPGSPTEPDGMLAVQEGLVWPATKSQALMAALDQAVIDSMPTDKEGHVARLQKELAAVADVRTKLQAAESNRAPDDEIADLSNQLLGHRENAARSQRMGRQLVGGDCERWLDALLGPSASPLDVACAHACLESSLNSDQCRADRLFGSRRAPERLKEVHERGVP